MKKVIILLVLTIAISSCNNKVKHDEEPKPSIEKITEEEALNLLHKWTAAYLEDNVASLGEVLDQSWVYSGAGDGQLSDKATAIKEFSNASFKFQDIVYKDLNVKLYNDIAIVRGSEVIVLVDNSSKDTTKLNLRFTDVYQKREGKVRAISTHSSPIVN